MPKNPYNPNIHLPKKFRIPSEYNFWSDEEQAWVNYQEVGLFPEDFYYDDLPNVITLDVLIEMFERFVAIIDNLVFHIRKCNFDEYECDENIEHYYSGSEAIAHNTTDPMYGDNYYYIFGIKELIAVELALSMLASEKMPWKMDVSPARERVDALKLKLWQLLPDFYKAHSYCAIEKPSHYDPDKPYAIPYVGENGFEGVLYDLLDDDDGEDSFFLTRQLYKEPYSEYGDDFDKLVKTLTSIPMNSYAQPHNDLAKFVQKFLVGYNWGHFSYDPEGPEYHFWSHQMHGRPNDIWFAITHERMDDRSREAQELLFSGVFNRKKLAFFLLFAFIHVGYFYEDDEWEKVNEKFEALRDMI